MGSIDTTPDYETLDWQERLDTMHQSYGFIPTTKGEQNLAFKAIPFLDRPGGVGGHLNEVLLHQSGQQIDHPDRAIRALVRDMDVYRQDAAQRRAGLLAVHHELQYVNPRLDVSVIEDLNITGLLSVVQFARLNAAIKSGDDTPLHGGIKGVNGRKRLVTAFDPETNDRMLTEMLVESLPDKRVVAIRGIVLAAGKSHRIRVGFWEKMLKSSQSHLVARPVVRQLLSA